MLFRSKLIAWMAQGVPAKPYYAESPGRWVAEPEWPTARIKPKRLYLNGGGALGTRAGKPDKLTVCTPQTLGLDCGELMPWFQHGASPEMPGDQRADDGKSVCFDTPPLKETLEILGTTQAELVVAVNRPVAFVCVRLCDVAPDGASTRVSYGVFNLTHVKGADKPVRLVPGRPYKVSVPLADTGYSFRKGHRIRVAVSTTYWPLIWPSPEPVAMTLHTGKSSIALPVRPSLRGDRTPPRFKPPEAAAPFAKTTLEPGGRNRVIHTDLGTGETVVEVTDSSGLARYDDIDLVAEARDRKSTRLNSSH